MNTDNAKQLATAAVATTTLGFTAGPAGLGLVAVGGPAVWAGAALVAGCIWLAAKESSN